MAQSALTVRERVAGASRQISRVKRTDRFAAWFIVGGGLAVVASVLGILVFISAEAIPLFRSPHAQLSGTLMSLGDDPQTRPLALGLDEHQTYLYAVRADATLALYRVGDGQLDRTLSLEGVSGAVVTAASRSLDDAVAEATADGRVVLTAVRFTPRYGLKGREAVAVELDPPTWVTLDEQKRPLRLVSYRKSDSGRTVAGVADNDLLIWQDSGDGAAVAKKLWTAVDEHITCISLGGTSAVVAGTDKGRVFHWELGPEPRQTSVSQVSTKAVTALNWIIGDSTFVAGTEAGELSAWFRTRLNDDDEPVTVRAHTFPAQSAAITALASSSRDRSFASVARDGSVVLRFATSERTLLSLPGDQVAADSVVVSPRGDAVFVSRRAAISRYDLDSPHPEITARGLFGRTWYEGYPRPDYVWQSTGATNDFEEKFSLVPLVFGTMKGTFYAMLFAVPLAVMAALYTSQFASPKIKSRVKPAVEVMAALPSVVIGFIAGLWLASLVEKLAVSVLLMMVLLPLFGTAGVLLMKVVPSTVASRWRLGSEVLVIVPLLLLAGWVALVLGTPVENALFGGDFRNWLTATLGMNYDQRNSLVVGIAMGFAVIPIIFTISEDAFSNVPSNLTAASLALGASRWQTALRIVVPTASPGVFSAIMVGFGRAVGETMIVLMATGNTPVLDWSIFNGMRTLSANIAVEISEAPHGGTLYRVLFLSAALLFAMTFVVNTVAELIRQRLRLRYRAL